MPPPGTDRLRVNRRLAFVRWVRRTHGWFGVWGALLGLMTGTSGVWLNHRSVMKLELPDQHQASVQLACPTRARPRPRRWRTGCQQTLKLDRPATNVRSERSRPVPWAERGGEGKPAMQPERWTYVFGGPNKVIQVEYWVGNEAAAVSHDGQRVRGDPHQPAQGHDHAGALDPPD